MARVTLMTFRGFRTVLKSRGTGLFLTCDVFYLSLNILVVLWSRLVINETLTSFRHWMGTGIALSSLFFLSFVRLQFNAIFDPGATDQQQGLLIVDKGYQYNLCVIISDLNQNTFPRCQHMLKSGLEAEVLPGSSCNLQRGQAGSGHPVVRCHKINWNYCGCRCDDVVPCTNRESGRRKYSANLRFSVHRSLSPSYMFLFLVSYFYFLG